MTTFLSYFSIENGNVCWWCDLWLVCVSCVSAVCSVRCPDGDWARWTEWTIPVSPAAPITAHPRLSLVMLRCCGAQAAVGQLLLRPTTLRSEDLSRVSSSRPLTGSRDFNSCDMEKPTSYQWTINIFTKKTFSLFQVGKEVWWIGFDLCLFVNYSSLEENEDSILRYSANLIAVSLLCWPQA